MKSALATVSHILVQALTVQRPLAQSMRTGTDGADQNRLHAYVQHAGQMVTHIIPIKGPCAEHAALRW